MLVHEPPYPPPPRHAPPDLGRRADRDASARMAGIAAHLVGILLFVAAPIAAAAAAVLCLTSEDLPLIVRAGGFVVCTAAAFLALKSLLPHRPPAPPGVVPIRPDAQPTAYAFIARVAADLGVAAPHRLFLGSGTELRLGGPRSLADLMRPPRWELHVGLWLWQSVTLSEFQALVARTLAPSAGPRLGRFRSAARSVLFAMTHGVDRIDEAARVGSSVAGLARIVSVMHRGLVFPIRLLGRLLLRIDPAAEDSRLDDLAAVRIAGSDALVNAIFRSDFAAAALAKADDMLADAAESGVWTANLYDHLGDGVRLLREAHNDFSLGELPVLRGPTAGKYTEVFPPGARYLSKMWAGFAPPDEREQEAKRDFVSAERDDRPAAELLNDRADLVERFTTIRYVDVLNSDDDYVPLPPMTVRRWLALKADTPFPAKYAGCYDSGRKVEPGTFLERQDAVAGESWEDARLLATAESLYLHAAERAEAWRQARKGLDRVSHRTLFHPTGRQRAEAEDFEDDLRKASRWLAALDRWAYVTHVHMAARLPDLGRHDALLARYDSVMRFQTLAADARRYRKRLAAYVARLDEVAGNVGYRLGREAGREFVASRKDFGAFLAEAGEINDPLLREWTGEVRLDEFLYSHTGRPRPKPRGVLSHGRELLAVWGEIDEKAQWLHRLGVGKLLELHEQIEREFAAQFKSRNGDVPWYAPPEAISAAAPTLPGLEPPAAEPRDIPPAEFVDEPPPEPGPGAGQWYDDWDRGN